jgi:hypothetical protein
MQEWSGYLRTIVYRVKPYSVGNKENRGIQEVGCNPLKFSQMSRLKFTNFTSLKYEELVLNT